MHLPEAAAELVAAPPVVNQGPHGIGAADTNVIEVRRVLLMPPADAPRLLTEAPLGTMTKAAFFQRFIQAGLAHADDGNPNWPLVLCCLCLDDRPRC